jgi:hypothetical protein
LLPTRPPVYPPPMLARRPGLETRALACVLSALAALAPALARAQAGAAAASAAAPLPAPAIADGTEAPCPEARALPRLTLDKVVDPAVPVVDSWQVLWSGVPLSDYQVAALGADDALVARTRDEVSNRGQWIYIGTLMAAAGTAVSSLGWVLYGRGEVQQQVTLPLAIGGILLGAAGLLTITENIQRPLEPLLAPTPEHRMTRDELRAIVARVNQKLYVDVCKAAAVTRAAAVEAATVKPPSGAAEWAALIGALARPRAAGPGVRLRLFWLPATFVAATPATPASLDAGLTAEYASLSATAQKLQKLLDSARPAAAADGAFDYGRVRMKVVELSAGGQTPLALLDADGRVLDPRGLRVLPEQARKELEDLLRAR